MAPVNNLEQRAAKKLAAAEGINYTEALRRIRSSGIKPSGILSGENVLVAEKATSEPTSSRPSVAFVQKHSSHGNFAVRTKFGDDPTTDEYFVSSRNLFACGAVRAGKTDLLRELIQHSAADPKSIVVWDAGGGISHEPDPDETDSTIDLTDAAVMTTNLGDFHRELSELLGRQNDGESVIVVDSLDTLLSDTSPIAAEVISMLVSALREGRQARISVYVSNQRILDGSDHPLVQQILSASQFALMGPARLEQHHSRDDIAKLPELVSGWLMTSGGSTLYRAQVPA